MLTFSTTGYVGPAAPPFMRPLLVLDTNCFIDAINARSHAHAAVQRLLIASRANAKVCVSLHSLSELEAGKEKHGSEAYDLARKYEILPYFPIGAIDELLGTIDGLAGTFDDMRINDTLQAQLATLAKAGNDLRDRGALVDALRAGADIFVTSDRHLVGSGPASRIRTATGLRVLAPASATLALSVGDAAES